MVMSSTLCPMMRQRGDPANASEVHGTRNGAGHWTCVDLIWTSRGRDQRGVQTGRRGKSLTGWGKFGGPGEIRTHDLFHAMGDRSITYKHRLLKTKDLVRCVLVPVWSQLAILFVFRPHPVFDEIHVENTAGIPRAFTCTRAVVSAVVMSSPFRETRDEDKNFLYTCESV